MVPERAILSQSNHPQKVLPVRAKPHIDESGLSFLFRTFTNNGLTFRDVGRWLDIHRWPTIVDKHVAKLALLTGSNDEDLFHRCCVAYGQRPARNYRFMSHVFGEGSICIPRSARICPICIKREKYAKANWLIKGVVGCHEHHLLLHERCTSCDRLVSWNRPAIDICQCGRFLTDSHKAISLPDPVTGWNRWVQLRFENKSVFAPDFLLPRGLDELSLDSCIRLIHAFGLLDAPDSSLKKSNMQAATCSGMAGVIQRGIERYTALETESKLGTSLIESIHMPALDRLRFSATCGDDARSVDWIFRELMRKSGRRLNGLGRYPRGQLSLL